MSDSNDCGTYRSNRIRKATELGTLIYNLAPKKIYNAITIGTEKKSD